jgi:hypothetical protein
MKVEIKPVDQKKWHGKTGEEDFTRPHTIRALVDARTNRYAVDLTTEELEKLGKELNEDLNTVYNPSLSVESFWDSKQAEVKLENNLMIFDTSITLDRIKIAIASQSPYVANSLKEFEEGVFPLATHIMINEKEEVEAKASKIQVRNEAIRKSEELTKDEKVSILIVLGEKNYSEMSNNFIDVEIDKMINKDPKKFLFHLKQDNIKLKSIVIDAIAKSILLKRGTQITYFESILGHSIDEVVNYLLDPDNESIKLAIMSRI